MNYPEGLRWRYNEVMYDERDFIGKFLKNQYDIRYGRQRDTWHFEPAVKMRSRYGNIEHVTDIMLDKDRFVIFILDDAREYECFDFVYGELSRIIEALPDADEIVKKNAIHDIARLCREYSVNLEEYPFVAKINGKKAVSVSHLDYIDGRVVAYNHNGKVVSDEYTTDFLVGLRDHINIEVLHHSNEYKELMELLSLEENMSFECANYGDATFVIDGTDMTFDVSSLSRDDKGNLVIYGNDIDADVCNGITLTEKEIKPQYLTSIIECMKPKYTDIMDTYNGHNPELVRKINDAWKNTKYHDRFGDILFALGCRDKQEIQDKFDVVIDCNDAAMDNAHQIMEGVCDDWDLETILSFIRYEE